MNQTDTLRPQLDRVQQIAFIVGGLGLVACVVGALLSTDQFFQSYLFAYFLWLGLGLGSLALLMVQFLVGGAWGVTIRRLLEAGMMTLPALAVLFVPILFGLQRLYIWLRPEVLAEDPIVAAKTPYLNLPFFLIRVVIYFAIWIGLAWQFNRMSIEQDRTGDPNLVRRFQRLSAPGLVLYVLSMTFAATDWGMSLEPEWFSSIYGGIFIVGQGLTTLATMIIVAALLRRQPALSEVMSFMRFRELGTLMFAFVVLWAYTSFSQYLIIWSANITEFTPYYQHRTQGGWEVFPLLLITFQFAVPFLLLLQRKVKDTVALLVPVAVSIFLMRVLDLFWLIQPSFHPEGFQIHWLDFAAVLGIGGIWVGVFAWRLKARAIVAPNDHRLGMARSQAAVHAHAHH